MSGLINNPISNVIKDKVGRDKWIYRKLKGAYCGVVHFITPMGYFRNYIWFPIDAFFRSKSPFLSFNKNSEFISNQKNKYYGKRAFIVATGPSLLMSDLDLLKDEITIGVNKIYRAYNKTSFRPTYYMALDPTIQKAYDTDGIKNISGFAKDGVFLNPQMERRYKGCHLMYVNHQNHWIHVSTPGFDLMKNLKWSSNPVWGMYDKYTITATAIEWAYYIGCREVYLIGVDCSYGNKWYFEESEDDVKSRKKMKSKEHSQDLVFDHMVDKSHLAGYRFLKRESKKKGLHIYNATRGGMLEVFDRVDFDSLF